MNALLSLSSKDNPSTFTFVPVVRAACPSFQMKPDGFTTWTSTSSDGSTGLTWGVMAAATLSPIFTVERRPSMLSSIGSTNGPSTFEMVVERISQGRPPCSPIMIPAKAVICSSVVEGSKNTPIVPFPSWIALGQSAMPTTVVPARSTSPKDPSSSLKAMTALQFPCVGNPLKLQGHPYAQLQYSR